MVIRNLLSINRNKNIVADRHENGPNKERTLWRILEIIVANTDQEEMLKQCQKDLAELIRCEFVNIKIYDREKDTLHLLGMGFYDPKLFQVVPPVLKEILLSVPIQNSISGRTLTDGIQKEYNLQEDSKLPLGQRKYFWTQFVEQTGVEGILSVPIPGVRDNDGPTIAVINLYTRNSARRFLDEDVDHVKKVASAIGQKLSTMRDAAELQAYQETARIIEKSVLLQTTMDSLAIYAREQTLTLSSDIFLLKESEPQSVPRNGAETRLWLVGSTGILSKEGIPLTSYENVWYRYQEGITGWAAYYRRIIRVTNCLDLKQQQDNLGLSHNGKFLHPNIESEAEHVNLIVVPIIANDRFYGIIRVVGRKTNLPVGMHSQTVLQIMAEQLGIRLAAHERAEDQEKRVAKARHTLASVFQMGVAGKDNEEPAFLQKALQCAMNAVGADTGAITFHVPERKQLDFQIYLPEEYHAQALQTPMPEDSNTWPISLAFQKQAIQHIADMRGSNPPMKSIHPDVQACLAAPITMQGRRIGVIACYRFAVGEFDKESVQTLEGIAQYIASIVLNRRLRDSLQQELRIRNEFLAVAAHQMASPIAAMESHCKLLTDPGTMTEERWQKVRNIISTSCQLTANILYQFTAVREVIDRSDFPINKKPMRLSRMLITAAALYQPAAWQKRMTIRVEQEALDALPELLADPKIMPQVFTNLLDNAIKYSKKGTLITLSLQDRGPGFCLICIHNIGIPISEVERKRVFEREYRSEIARAFNPVGNGLGLPIAQAIIERHGGSVSVTSEPAHDHKGYANVRFYVKVPL